MEGVKFFGLYEIMIIIEGEKGREQSVPLLPNIDDIIRVRCFGCGIDGVTVIVDKIDLVDQVYHIHVNKVGIQMMSAPYYPYGWEDLLMKA